MTHHAVTVHFHQQIIEEFSAMFLTVSDVAQRLNVSRQFVYKIAASGDIEHHRFGGAIRFTEKQVEEYLEKTRVEKDPLSTEVTHLDL